MTGLTALAVLGVLVLGLVVGIAFGAGMTFLIMRTERAGRDEDADELAAFDPELAGIDAIVDIDPRGRP